MTIDVKDATGATIAVKTVEEVHADVTGAAADAAWGGAGDGKVIAILKAVYAKIAAIAQLPAALGPQTSANSLSVAPSSNGVWPIAGPGAHDAAVSGNPLRIAARAISSLYTAVANGDTADLVSTLVGALIVKPYSIPESDWTFTGFINSTANSPAKAAAGAGLRNYVTGLQVTPDGTDSFFEIRDASTVIWKGKIAAAANPAVVRFATPLKSTANTTINVGLTAGTTSTYVNLQGYVAP